MTTAADYLRSAAAALERARINIVATCTEPERANAAAGYLKACPNPADAKELAATHSLIEDAEADVAEALKLLTPRQP